MQDILLIGLGIMGGKVLAEFGTLLKDRLRIMDKEAGEAARCYFIHFPLDTPFDYAACSARLLAAVKDSAARKFNRDLLYFAAGNLGEAAVAGQVIDFGYMLELLQINGLLRKKEAVCYLTFSDLLGYAAGSAEDAESAGAIYRYCEQLALCSRERRYVPPYTNADGIGFNEINTPGPYDRSYLFVTPGGEEEIHTATVNVFAEKIFYEIYCFHSALAEAGKQVHALRQEAKAGNCFSAFSFVQVPRLTELQQYYLEYCFQEKLTELNLLTDVKAVNAGYYKKVFLEAIECAEPGGAFPCSRMVDLFVKKHLSQFANILTPYISETDFTHYGAECERRINGVLESIEPHFNAFLESEMQALGAGIKQLATDLFRVEPLLGHFALYSEFFRDLAGYISCWPVSLEKRAAEIAAFDIKPHFDRAQLAINALNSNKLLDFVLFKPVKQQKVREILKEIPFDSWIRGKIEKRLIRLLLAYFLNPGKNANHPLCIVKDYLKQLDAFLSAVREHTAVIAKKKNYIVNLLSFYYVVSWEKPETFGTVLARLENRSFGTHNNQLVLDYARSFFSAWLKEQTDIYDIFYSAHSYLDRLEAYTREKGKHLFGIGRDVDNEENFARKMEAEVEARLENLTAKAFTTVSHNYLKHLSLILAPVVAMRDPLSLRLEDMAKKENVIYKETSGAFTLGSMVFIREYLYMPLSDLVKYGMFKKYAVNEQPGTTQAVSPAPGREEELLARYTRSIIKQYFSAALGKLLYRQVFNADKETLSAEDLDALSRALAPAAVLEMLGDADLKNVAREYNAVISADRQKMITMIERNIRLDLKKRLSRE